MLLSKINIRGTSWADEESGNCVLHADEPHALVTAAGYLKFKLAAQNSEGIYFRGQRKLYGRLEPSLYRGLSTQNAQNQKTQDVVKTIDAFRKSGSIFSGFGDYAHEPLLQHYGISTAWIDLVDNIWVALWFACHRALTSGKYNEYWHFEKRLPSVEEKYAYILLIAADIDHRNRTKPGYFFGKTTELVDLRMAAPSVFLRPHAQHGLLFRCRGRDGSGRPRDYSNQLRGVIRVDLERALRWLGEGQIVGIHSLFPPPYYDNGYQILLGCGIDPKLGVGTIAHVGA